jgi:hypothetical protein
MRFFPSRLLCVLAILFSALVSSSPLQAQTNYGSLRGEVKDSQGASIGAAQVTLTNMETKLSHTEVTNSAGIYQFAAVDPGTYKVTVTMPGFKTFETNGAVVNLGATLTIDANLVVGSKG